MLKVNNNYRYCLFPSWAELGFKWEQLDDILKHPLKHGLLDRNDIKWLRSKNRYPPVTPPYELIEGPAGGGIIKCDETDLEQPTLVYLLLSKTTSFVPPPGMPPRGMANAPDITVLEARADLSLRLGRRLPVNQYCRVSPEHVNSAGDSVYWLFNFKSGRTPPKGLETLPRLAAEFGCMVEAIEKSASFMGEDSSSLASLGEEQVWLRVTSGSTSANLHFTILVYLALHLRSVARRRLESAHLVAAIEGEPRVYLDV
jgi:hypothetical protein